MKILIYTDYIGHKSGYARMFKDILPYLKKNNEIAHVALGWNGYPLNTRDFKVYHTKLDDIKDYYAPEVLHYALDDFKPDIVLTIQDYWIIHKIAFNLAHPGNGNGFIGEQLILTLYHIGLGKLQNGFIAIYILRNLLG